MARPVLPRRHEAAGNGRGPRSRLLVLGVLAALAAAVAGPPAAAGDGEATSGAQDVLAVLHAGGGTFVEAGAGHRLTLSGVSPRAVWFADRPARDTGSYSIDELDDVFFGGAVPPNGALEVFSGRAAGTVLVLELSDPRYQQAKDRLVLDARVLAADEITAAGLGGLTARAGDEVPTRFGPAALFLDATCAVDHGTAYDVDAITCADANQIVDDYWFDGRVACDPNSSGVPVADFEWVCVDNGDGTFEFFTTGGTVAFSFAPS